MSEKPTEAERAAQRESIARMLDVEDYTVWKDFEIPDPNGPPPVRLSTDETEGEES